MTPPLASQYTEISKIRNAADELAAKSYRKKLQLNEGKCKELRTSFGGSQRQLQPTVINDKPIKVVPKVKLLGLNISSDLKWNCHISEILKEAPPVFTFSGS